MNDDQVRRIVEAALLVAEQPLGRSELLALFDPADPEGAPDRAQLERVLGELAAACDGRGVELKEVASGFRYQARAELARWINRLWEQRAPRFSRALLETLAIIAYRQPITRGEIEEIRGVSVSTGTMKTLLDRGWVRVAGHRDVPGRPAVYTTTREFLDYFNLKSLDDLPPLAELRDIGDVDPDLFAGEGAPAGEGPAVPSAASGDDGVVATAQSTGGADEAVGDTAAEGADAPQAAARSGGEEADGAADDGATPGAAEAAGAEPREGV